MLHTVLSFACFSPPLPPSPWLWRDRLAVIMDLADSLEKRTTALTVSDVAALLNISERQVYKLASDGRIPSFKIGGSVRFDPSAFAQWLRQKMGPTSVSAQESARVRRA